MNSTELLQSLLTLFEQEIPDARFVRAYRGAVGQRAPQKPVVTGEVLSERVQPASVEAKLGFRIYLPPEFGAENAESLFEQMCRLCSAQLPACSAISREGTSRDTETGLLTVLCTLTFYEATMGVGQGVRTVTVGGKVFDVDSVSVAMQTTADTLTAIGETEPFARYHEKTVYTVTLTGIETLGLCKITGFTAIVGDVEYIGCRWKLISDGLHKAQFVTEQRRYVND